MSKLERRFNKRGRVQPKETRIDDTEEKKLTKDFLAQSKDDIFYSKGIDEANALILPAKKRKVKHKYDIKITEKKLSKKEKKRLEKIVETKERKQNRQKLFETLQKHQASEKEQEQFVSIVSSQSNKKTQARIEKIDVTAMKINVISGSHKKTKQNAISQEHETSETSSDDDPVDSDASDDDVDAQLEIAADLINEESKSLWDEGNTNSCEGILSDNKDMTEDLPSIEVSNNQQEPDIPIITKYVMVDRVPKIAVARMKLPILEEEQKIVETINENLVTIVCGETGSGKTTQVPQFLYEAGYCELGMMGVTEPRRVAAISMAARVAEEMNMKGASTIAYQIRYEGNADDSTKIKFMTDGVLLKEIQSDFLLWKYSTIIIDEAHERSVYSDILIGLLSRIVPLRLKKGKPLKLVIMSATLRVEDFTNNSRLFKKTPPCLHINARQYPVTIHFNKRTPSNFVDEAFKKASKIHRTLPDGGMLVFVTGRQEVNQLCSRLRRAFPSNKNQKHCGPGSKSTTEGNTSAKANQDAVDVETKPKSRRNKRISTSTSLPLKIDLNNYLIIPEDEETAHFEGSSNNYKLMSNSDEDIIDEDSDGDAVGDEPFPNETPFEADSQPLHVLPLFSLLSTDKQALIFVSPPEGHRLCIVATNVAETSLTIPNIRYVIDSGKVKVKVYDRVTGVSAFTVAWTSQASANQRAGRAGRTGPGHCYRLYSSAIFNDNFPKFSPPEVTLRPVDDLFLHMKDLGIDKVINFPFPTPPSSESLLAAEKLLISLGALKEDPQLTNMKGKTKKEIEPEKFPARITEVGRLMALFPISPRYSKMLALGHQHGCLPYVIAIISALTVQEVLFQDKETQEDDADTSLINSSKQLQNLRQQWAGKGNCRKLGDLMVLLKAVGAAEFEGCSSGFCEQFGLRFKAMNEIRKLRGQLTRTVNALLEDQNLLLDPKMSPPSDIQAKLLCQIVLSGCADHVARKLPNQTSSNQKPPTRNAYEGTYVADPLFIHPSSVLFKDLPDFVVYQETTETTKLYMKGIIQIEPHWLPVFAPQYCAFSAPLDNPQPTYCNEKGIVICHQTSTFGPHAWPMPSIARAFPEGVDRFRWFARFLLEGQVVASLAKFSSVLLSSPVIMMKSWAKLQPRTEAILNGLMAEDVHSRDNLKTAFESRKDFLLKEYLQWIPKALHDQVKDIWPPMEG